MEKITFASILFFTLFTVLINAQDQSLRLNQHDLIYNVNEAMDNEDFNKAIVVCRQILKNKERFDNFSDSLLAFTFRTLGKSYMGLDKLSQAELVLDSCLQINMKIQPRSNIQTGSIFQDLGALYYLQNDLEKSIEYYDKAIVIFKRYLPITESELSSVYSNLGVCYALLSDYSTSASYMNKALELDIKLFGPNNRKIGITYNNLGILYNYQGKITEARLAYLESKRVMAYNGMGETIQMAALSHNIGELFSDEKNFPAAIRQLREALTLRQKILPPNDNRIIKNYWVIAQVYLDWKKYQAAIEALQTASELAASNPNSHWEDQKDIYQLLGECRLQQGRLDRAQQYFAAAKAAIFAHPTKFQESRNSRKRILWADLLSLEADVQSAHFKQDPQTKFLLSAREGYQNALAVYRQARRQLRGAASSRSWLERYYQYFEKAIANNLQLAQAQSDRRYQEEAFQWAEQCRALALRDALQESQAEHFAGLSTKLLDQEQELKNQISDLEENLFQAEEEGGADSTLLRLRASIFDEQQALDSLIRFFERDYPTYYQLKYEETNLSLPQIQQSLRPQQALLQYFVGEETLFVFVIQSDHFSVSRFPLDFPLAKWVSDWRQAINDFAADQQKEEAQKRYDKLSYQLYQKLIAPIADQLPAELVIVADGVLGYLPFEALLASAPQHSGRFRQYDFLLRHYQMSYAFSSTWWYHQHQDKRSRASESGILAVAPSFGKEELAWSDRAEGLGALRFNRQEAEGIVERWGGKLLAGTAASETAFKQHATEYPILHLATHAKANDRMGDFSYLAFTQSADSTENALLYARELYDLPLKAELVVLSACETGIGELQKGEGVISLARGFSYAGARSILTTLWRVSDDKAHRLMTGFYEGLGEGKTKAAALQECKLNYLSECRDREAHPFYWAAFVGLGNMETISLTKAKNWYLYLGGLAFAVILLLVFQNRQTKLPTPSA